MNKVILKGNIGRTPRFSLTQKGKEVAKFFLATSMSWKGKDSEWQTHTEWHRITVFKESTIRWLKDILKQGDTIYVEGKLSYHRWTDKYGQARGTPHIMITKHDGRVEFIRSPHTRNQETRNHEDQKKEGDYEETTSPSHNHKENQ